MMSVDSINKWRPTFIIWMFIILLSLDFIHLMAPFPHSVTYLPSNPEDFVTGYTVVVYESRLEYVQTRALPNSILLFMATVIIAGLDWIFPLAHSLPTWFKITVMILFISIAAYSESPV